MHFIPAHPVAGTENSGPDAGFAELFVNRWCILTPVEGTQPEAVEKLQAFWEKIGANVAMMTPDHHDLVLAITSHLPHLIAYTIVGTADELGDVTESEVLKFSAGGFRDFTRIAASDPTMWRDVFLHNKEAVLEMLGTFNEDLSKLTRAIRRGDGEALFEHFTRTRAIRRGIVTLGQDSAAPDFGRPHGPLPIAPIVRPYASDDDPSPARSDVANDGGLEQRRRLSELDRTKRRHAVAETQRHLGGACGLRAPPVRRASDITPVIAPGAILSRKLSAAPSRSLRLPPCCASMSTPSAGRTFSTPVAVTCRSPSR